VVGGIESNGGRVVANGSREIVASKSSVTAVLKSFGLADTSRHTNSVRTKCSGSNIKAAAQWLVSSTSGLDMAKMNEELTREVVVVVVVVVVVMW
jgi:hypothetical protein